MNTTPPSNNPEFTAEEKVSTAPTASVPPTEDVAAVEVEDVEAKSLEDKSDKLTEAPKHSHKWMYLIIVFLVLAVVGVVGALFAFLPLSRTESNQSDLSSTVALELKGEVAIVEGVVEKLNDDSWAAIKVGEVIATSDVLRTGENSRVVINLDDGSAVRLDQNSSLAFTKLSNSAITLTQLSGRAYHRVQKGELVYSVKSLNTTATALGTSFTTITDEGASSSQVLVLESKVKVATKEVKDDVQVGEGEIAVVDNAKHEVKVATIDPKALEEEFYVWNTALNEGKEYVKATPTPTPTPEQTQSPTQTVKGLTLSATPIVGGVKLSWVMSGQTAPKGFKIIKASHANPTFGQDHASYVSDPNARSYEWTGLSSSQYYFRVGIYNGEGISWYSNVVAATPQAKPAKETSAPYSGSINLSAVVESGNVKLNWTATKTETVHGWKLVYSTASNPTYPDDNPIFIDTKSLSYTLKSLPSGTYHFRVGAWIDGAVASNAYSNDVTVVVP